jgi:type VI protein secretion system component VasF
MFAVALAVFVGLRVSLSHQLADLTARVDQLGH